MTPPLADDFADIARRMRVNFVLMASQDDHKLPFNLRGKPTPRCQHVLWPSDAKTRAPDGPRQCRATAKRGHEYCDQHITRHQP